ISADTDMKYLQTVTRNLLNLSPSREMSLLSTARCVMVPTLEPAGCAQVMTGNRVTLDIRRDARASSTHLLVESRNRRLKAGIRRACAAGNPASSASARVPAFRSAHPDTVPACGQSLR